MRTPHCSVGWLATLLMGTRWPTVIRTGGEIANDRDQRDYVEAGVADG